MKMLVERGADLTLVANRGETVNGIYSIIIGISLNFVCSLFLSLVRANHWTKM